VKLNKFTVGILDVFPHTLSVEDAALYLSSFQEHNMKYEHRFLDIFQRIFQYNGEEVYVSISELLFNVEYTGGACGAMRYTVKGKFGGKTVEVTWDNGHLIGMPTIVNMIRIHSDVLGAQREPIGPVCGPYKEQDYLNDPLAALFLMQDHFFEEIVKVTGDVPEAPRVPDGAIS